MLSCVIPGLAIVLLIVIAAALLWSLTKRPPVEHVSCARCLYSVEFAPARHCQECGADLTEVGVLTPAMDKTPRQPARMVFIMCFALLLAALIGLAAGVLAAAILPQTTTQRALWRITGAASGLYSEIGVAAETDARGKSARLTSVCVWIVDLNGVSSGEVCQPLRNRALHYDAEENEFTNVRGDATPFQKFLQPGDVTLAMLRDAATSLNLDPDDPLLEEEFREAIAAVPESFRLSGVFGVPIAHFSGFEAFHWRPINVRPHPAAPLLGIVAGLLLWVLLIALARRANCRDRDRQRAAAAEILCGRVHERAGPAVGDGEVVMDPAPTG